jgi:hypothetical protein
MTLVIGLHSNIAMMWVELRDECHDINWTWVQGMQCGRFGGIGSGGCDILLAYFKIGMLWRRRKMRKKFFCFHVPKEFFLQ